MAESFSTKFWETGLVKKIQKQDESQVLSQHREIHLEIKQFCKCSPLSGRRIYVITNHWTKKTAHFFNVYFTQIMGRLITAKSWISVAKFTE